MRNLNGQIHIYRTDSWDVWGAYLQIFQISPRSVALYLLHLPPGKDVVVAQYVIPLSENASCPQYTIF